MSGDGPVLLVCGDDIATNVSTGLHGPIETVTTAAETAARVDGEYACVVAEHQPPERDSFDVVDAVPDRVPVVVVEREAPLSASRILGAGAADFVTPSVEEDGDAAIVTRVERAIRTDADAEEASAGRTPVPAAAGSVDEQYRQLVEQDLFGIYILQGGRIRYANQRAAEIFGYEPAELMDGMTGFDVVAESDHETLKENLRRIRDGEIERVRDEYTGLRKDGSTVEFEFQSAVIEYDDEPALLGVVTDITERKQRRMELERYETMIEAIPEAVFTIDEDGYVISTNESACDQYGYSREDFREGVHYSDLIADDDVVRFEDATNRAAADPDGPIETITVTHTGVTEDGRRFPAEAHFGLLATSDGVIAAGISIDISDRKQRKRRLKVLNRVLRHNLRNDLSVIRGEAEYIETKTDDAKLQAHAETVIGASERISAMSNEIRGLEETLGSTGDHGEINLAEVVRTVVDSYRDGYPAVEIDTDLPETMPVEGSEELETVVTELVENAIEHTDSDEPRVDVTLEQSQTRPGDWIELRVADHGPGIPETERDVVTGSEDITQLTHASGLGLWTVVWIVDAHDGEIEITNNEPRGSVVKVFFE